MSTTARTAAGTGLSDAITRRGLLKAAPVALTAALPAAALATAEPESEITRLFRQWLALEASFKGLSEEEADARCGVMREIASQMVAIPTRTVEELAQKIVAATLHCQTDMEGPLAAEVLALAGVEGSAPAVEDPGSEIMRRFRDCVALNDRLNDFSVTEEEWDAIYRTLDVMEKELTALPSRSAQDMAAKVAIWTCYLSEDALCVDSSDAHPVVAEIKALVGLGS